MTKNNLRALRLKKKMTQIDLAKSAGTTQQTVFRIEKGTRNLTVDMAKRFADVLDCLPSDIIPDLGNPTMTEREKALIDNFRHLTPEQQDALCALGVSMAQPVKKDEAG